MFILRLIAVMFLILAAIAVGVEIVGFARTAHWHGISAGQLWLNLHPSSLDGAHAFIQRYVSPALWDPVMIWFLRQPAWAATGLPGLALLWLALGMSLGAPRRRERPRFRASA
jgi:hypothetical protein